MPKTIICVLILFSCIFTSAQKQDTLSIKNGIDNPSLLSTHHFGLFSSRLNTNFKHRAPKNISFSLNHSSGNVYHPFVEAYFPKDPAERARLSQYEEWHHREFEFIDQQTTPADYMNIFIDAVIKEFRATVNIPLNKYNELVVSMRSYLITKGKYPFSVFTSDESIEWFHSNIAGGEDTFGRRYHGLNQVHFKYLDRNGKSLNLNHNDFFVGGLEFNHYYYPKLAINSHRNIFINLGSHLGVNTSRFNPSIDAGFSANAIKTFNLSTKNDFNFALGANILRKNLINFKEVLDLGNNPYLGTFNSEIEFTFHTQKGNFNAIGVNYQIQTRFNKKKEADYYKIEKTLSKVHFFWYNGVYSLYKPQSNWNLIYTYGTPKYLFSLFVKQDLTVNNAPDIQTGIGLKFPLIKK